MEFLSNSLHNIANEKIIIIILGRFVIFAGGYDNFKRLFIGRQIDISVIFKISFKEYQIDLYNIFFMEMMFLKVKDEET